MDIFPDIKGLLKSYSKNQVRDAIVNHVLKIMSLSAGPWAWAVTKLIDITFDKLVWPALHDLGLEGDYVVDKEKFHEIMVKYINAPSDNFRQEFEDMMRGVPK